MKICKSITDWYLGNNKDIEHEVPKAGLGRLFYLMWNHLDKFFVINVVFILCCIPIVTIPAAVCGMNRYFIKMYQDGYGFELSDFFHEFRLQLIKSIPIGIPLGLLMFYGYYLLRMSYEFQNGEQASFVWMIGIACMLFAALFGNICFVLLSSLDLPNKYIVKNAFILILCEWKASLLGLISVMALCGMFLLFFPYSVVFPLLGCFSFTQFLVCSSIFPAVHRRIIEPYEKRIVQ
jgi:hypothetical protein